MHTNRSQLVRLAHELIQQKLASQASSAIGADARAMSYAGLCFASSALLLGLANDAYSPVAMVIGGVAFVVSAGIASYSARPILFYMPGACLSDVQEDIDTDREVGDVLLQLSDYAETHISKNRTTLSDNADLLNLSQKLSFASAIVASVPQLLFYIYS